MRLRALAGRRPVVALALASSALLAGACPSLDEIPLGECGNGVKEEDLGEECDAAPDAPDKTEKKHCARASEANACHYVWDDATCCPANMGEGLDGRCRRPSGEFDDEPMFQIEEPAFGLGAGDVDGDGFVDMAIRYASREIEVRFQGPNADPAVVRDVQPSPAGSQSTFGFLTPAIDEAFDGCDRPTVFRPGTAFIPGEAGVRVLLGGPDGLLPKAFPAFDTGLSAAPVALPALACYEALIPGYPPLDCAGALADYGGGVALLAVDLASGAEFDAQDPPRRMVYPGVKLEEVGKIRQRIALPRWSGCDGFAVSFGDGDSEFANTLSVLGMCGPGQLHSEVLAVIDVPERVFIVDANRDGADDVVLADDDHLSVLLGDGAGQFGDDGEPSYEIDVAFGGGVLAVGLLDDDEGLDYVLPKAIIGSRCTGDTLPCEPVIVGGFPSEGALTDAVIADVNGDGQGDIVGPLQAGAANDPALAVVLSNDRGIYTLDVRPTPLLPKHFSRGDFDGDGIDDVVMVLPVAADRAPDAPAIPCTEFDDVQVLYGARGAPGEVITVAQVAGIKALATGLIDRSVSYIDGIHDIGLTRECEDADAVTVNKTKHEATILFGNASRGVDSPYLLAEGVEQELHLFATGRVVGEDDHPDLIALGLTEGNGEEDQGLGLWTIESGGAAELPPGGAVGRAPGSFAPHPTDLNPGDRAYTLVVGDLDFECGPRADPARCPTDEIVVFQSSGASTHSPTTDEPRISIYASDGNNVAFAATSGPCPDIRGSKEFIDSVADPVEDFEDFVTTFENAAIVDVDGDGYQDVVASWFGITPGTSMVGAGDAYVFWNGPAGFAGTCPARIGVPEGLHILSLEPFDPGDGERWFAFSAETGVYFAKLTGRDLSACADLSDETRCRAKAELGGAGSLSFLDYDHDGLQDLFVANLQGIRGFRQKAHDEVQAAKAAEEAERQEEEEKD